MDIVNGLTALSQAVGIAREIRDLNQSVDQAAFKLKVAELHERLSDAKMALSDAKIEQSNTRQTISELTAEIDRLKNGDVCPKCRSGRLQLISTKPFRQLGAWHYGVEDWEYRCDQLDCAFEQTRKHDPQGVLPKLAGRQ